MGHEGLFGIRKNNAPSIFFPSFWTLNSKPFFFCKFVLLDSTWETHTSPLFWLSTLEAHPTTPSPDSPVLRVPPPPGREGHGLTEAENVMKTSCRPRVHQSGIDTGTHLERGIKCTPPGTGPFTAIEKREAFGHMLHGFQCGWREISDKWSKITLT